jgi:C-terminal peptidase prc
LLLAFGLKGAGQLWLDDVQIEPLGELVWSEIHAQSEQLETLQEAWTLINRKYLYEDFNGVDWQKMWTQTSAKVEDGLSEEAFWRLMEGMVAALDDDHSVFLTPDEVDTQFALFKGEGEYSGIGVYVQKVFDPGFHVVTFVFPDSPAQQVGIRPHDRLLQADGLPICCPGDKGPLGEVSGPAGTEVKLTVQTPGEAPRDLVIERQSIEAQLDVVTRIVADNVGYIFLPSFEFEGIGEALTTAWADLNATNDLAGLVIDLRTNPGGQLTELDEILALFTDGRQGEFYARDEVRPLQINGRDVAHSQTIPLVLLVSSYSNSSAEMMAGVLQESGRAMLVGSQTLGNVEAVYNYLLTDGSMLWLAEEGFHSNNGVNWDGLGIKPDVEVQQAWHEFATDADDLALQKAIDLLHGE